MKTPVDEIAAAELARAGRLEAMANGLLVEVREIRSRYAQPRPRRNPVNLVELAKNMKDRR